MDTAISHKEMRMDNGSDFLVDDFFDICVAVPIDAIASFSLLFVSECVPLAQPSVYSHKQWCPFAMKMSSTHLERLDSRRTIHADGQQFVGGSYLFSYHCISVCIAVCQKSTK